MPTCLKNKYIYFLFQIKVGSGARSCFFFSAEKTIRIRPYFEMKITIYLYFKYVVIKFDLMNNHFKLEFVDSGLYFVEDENNFKIRCSGSTSLLFRLMFHLLTALSLGFPLFLYTTSTTTTP